MKPNKTFIAGVIFLAIILGVTYVFAQTPEEKARQQVIKEQTKYDEIELELQVQREILDQALQVHGQYIEAKEQELEEYKIQELKVSEKPVTKLIAHMQEVENKVTCTSGYDSWINDRVQYAYDISGGDMDFIGTIASESMFDYDAVGDGGRSFGLCQIHDYWNKEMQMKYRSLTTWEEKIEFCYQVYKDYKDRWVVQNRLYGYNVRQKGLEKLQISCE